MTREKDFNKWNIKKQKINEISRTIFFHEGEIWWCNVGVNVGYEIDGKEIKKDFVRPVLIIKKISTDTFIGIPLTKKEIGIIEKKKLTQFYYKLGTIKKGEVVYDNLLELSQIRLFDKRRLVHKYKELNKNNLNKVIKKNYRTYKILGPPAREVGG